MVELVGNPDIGKACRTTPEDFGAGVSVAVTSKVPAQLAQQAHRFIQTRGQRRWGLGAAHEAAQRFPFRIGEVDCARHLRGLLAEGG